MSYRPSSQQHPFTRLILLLSILVIFLPLSQGIPNCIKEFSPTECLTCSDGFTLQNKSCLPCQDQHCKSCAKPNTPSCLQCNSGFILSNKQCRISCNTISNCDICSPAKTKCITCSNGCQPQASDGQCKCATKLISIIVCLIISFIVVLVVAFCLTYTSTSRKNKFVQLALNASTNEADIIQNAVGEHRNVIVSDEDIDYHTGKSKSRDKSRGKGKKAKETHEPLQLTIISTETNLPKSIGEEKSLCDYCLVEVSIERLSCGCHLCSKHHSAKINSRKEGHRCPICNKEVNDVEVLRCGMCNQVSAEYFQLSCKCGMQVCNECCKRQEMNQNQCPNCIKLDI